MLLMILAYLYTIGSSETEVWSLVIWIKNPGKIELKKAEHIEKLIDRCYTQKSKKIILETCKEEIIKILDFCFEDLPDKSNKIEELSDDLEKLHFFLKEKMGEKKYNANEFKKMLSEALLENDGDFLRKIIIIKLSMMFYEEKMKNICQQIVQFQRNDSNKHKIIVINSNVITIENSQSTCNLSQFLRILANMVNIRDQSHRVDYIEAKFWEQQFLETPNPNKSCSENNIKNQNKRNESMCKMILYYLILHSENERRFNIAFESNIEAARIYDNLNSVYIEIISDIRKTNNVTLNEYTLDKLLVKSKISKNITCFTNIDSTNRLNYDQILNNIVELDDLRKIYLYEKSGEDVSVVIKEKLGQIPASSSSYASQDRIPVELQPNTHTNKYSKKINSKSDESLQPNPIQTTKDFKEHETPKKNCTFQAESTEKAFQPCLSITKKDENLDVLQSTTVSENNFTFSKANSHQNGTLLTLLKAKIQQKVLSLGEKQKEMQERKKILEKQILDLYEKLSSFNLKKQKHNLTIEKMELEAAQQFDCIMKLIEQIENEKDVD